MSEKPDSQEQEPTWKTSLPFPRKWLAYVAIKFIVLGIVIYVALRMYGFA